jgi:hypothetical protein
MQRRSINVARSRSRSVAATTYSEGTVLTPQKTRRDSIFNLKPTGERPPRALWAELGKHRLSTTLNVNDIDPVDESRSALFSDIVSRTARLKPTLTK